MKRRHCCVAEAGAQQIASVYDVARTCCRQLRHDIILTRHRVRFESVSRDARRFANCHVISGCARACAVHVSLRAVAVSSRADVDALKKKQNFDKLVCISCLFTIVLHFRFISSFTRLIIKGTL